jgi:hypothetical protein
MYACHHSNVVCSGYHITSCILRDMFTIVLICTTSLTVSIVIATQMIMDLQKSMMRIECIHQASCAHMMMMMMQCACYSVAVHSVKHVCVLMTVMICSQGGTLVAFAHVGSDVIINGCECSTCLFSVQIDEHIGVIVLFTCHLCRWHDAYVHIML